MEVVLKVFLVVLAMHAASVAYDIHIAASAFQPKPDSQAVSCTAGQIISGSVQADMDVVQARREFEPHSVMPEDIVRSENGHHAGIHRPLITP